MERYGEQGQRRQQWEPERQTEQTALYSESQAHYINFTEGEGCEQGWHTCQPSWIIRDTPGKFTSLQLVSQISLAKSRIMKIAVLNFVHYLLNYDSGLLAIMSDITLCSLSQGGFTLSKQHNATQTQIVSS